jgi:phosphatidylethanolamine-binding protein (PEBP) family uncharacterized protein
MLEHVPGWLGHALRNVRAGADKLAVAQPGLQSGPGVFAALELTSPAFADGARLPERFTADGAGVSPPLTWGRAPEGTSMLALIVEDGDGSPTGGDVGRNSFFAEGWLPPDPPTGHGEHRYVFQLFALGEGCGDPGRTPGRGALVSAMAGHVLAAGVLTGTYSRGDPAAVGPGTAAQTRLAAALT